MNIGSFLTATLSIASLNEEPATLLVEFYNEDGESQGPVDEYELGAYASLVQDVLPASYGLTFERADVDPVTCIVTIAEGQELFFTLVREHILVVDLAAEPGSTDDLFVETSDLCKL